MYISVTTYGGYDWHDAVQTYEQLQYQGSYNIADETVNDVIADHIGKRFPTIKNIREYVLQAILGKSICELYSKEVDYANTPCKNHEIEVSLTFVAFDGNEMKLTEEYLGGTFSYATYYDVENIPDNKVCYVVTEDFLAVTKGMPVVQRMYHDIFQDCREAESYMGSLRLHDSHQIHCNSVKTFLIGNKEKITQTEWYKEQKLAMRLMEEKGQTPANKSFCIFTKDHIEALENILMEGTR